MKDLAKENLRLSIENRQLKKKIVKLEREYLELARFAQEREAVRSSNDRRGGSPPLQFKPKEEGKRNDNQRV